MLEKSVARAQLIGARRMREARVLAAARAAVRDVILASPAAQSATCVAAYVPLRTEPGSPELLDGLARGAEVLVPILLPDNDLDWQAWPDGPAQGPGAIAGADLVLVPALAVARDGTRLGRGGGSYDRALARVRPGVPVVALLFEGELLDELPADPWDLPVTATATPSGWTDLA